MMKIKTSELTSPALDWAVAKCENKKINIVDFDELGVGIVLSNTETPDFANGSRCYAPSHHWAQGGPIIEREAINLSMERESLWVAEIYAKPYYRRIVFTRSAETPLIAAMRCYCASKFGDEIEIPEELK